MFISSVGTAFMYAKSLTNATLAALALLPSATTSKRCVVIYVRHDHGGAFVSSRLCLGYAPRWSKFCATRNAPIACCFSLLYHTRRW